MVSSGKTIVGAAIFTGKIGFELTINVKFNV